MMSKVAELFKLGMLETPCMIGLGELLTKYFKWCTAIRMVENCCPFLSFLVFLACFDLVACVTRHNDVFLACFDSVACVTRHYDVFLACFDLVACVTRHNDVFLACFDSVACVTRHNDVFLACFDLVACVTRHYDTVDVRSALEPQQ
jgi:hypothetical protein